MQPVADFRHEYPNCRVSISASEDLARLEFGEAHIAVRAGAKPDYPDYVVQPFTSFELNLYAHQSYIEKHGAPKNTGELAKHVFVVPLDERQALPFSDWIAEFIKEDQIAVKSHDLGVGMDAIQMGLGIGFMSDFHASKYPDLHRIPIANEKWIVKQWLVTHVDLHRTGKVQAMLKHLKNSPAC
jgi:DNA-binding transcriptional LysR family regulator